MKRREEPIPALSAGLSYVMLTGLLLLAANPQLLAPLEAVATRMTHAPVAAGVPGPATSPVPSAAAPASAPPSASVPPSGAVVAEPVVDEWPAEDIARGREQCMHLLTGVSADIEYLEPIKKGPCGLPAPVRLKSVGSDTSKVVFDPPVDVNCRMVAALGNWVKTTLQPNARARLKSEVVRIVRASGYSCRNIYNLPNAKLSQHALANAIDIGGFALANGRTVGVLNGWGLTVRDIKAQEKAKAAAEAKAKADAKAGGAKAASSRAGDAKAAETAASGKAGKLDKSGRPVAQASLTTSTPKAAKKAAADAAAAAKATTVALEKSKDPAKPSDPATPTKEAMFLRAVHGGACGAFGTVLGPEANDPHRNHFHLDLIPRRGRGYCE